LALTGQLGADALTSDPVAEAMSLCVSCKACKRECPTGVDMAKMKIEVTAARAAKHGLSRRDKLIANLPGYAGLASRHAGLANLLTGNPLSRYLGEKMFGLAAGRRLPAWRKDVFDDDEQRAAEPAVTKGRVYLWADTFNRYFEPENLRAALKVIAAAGYTPVIPSAGARPACCGRTYLASGMVEQARI